MPSNGKGFRSGPKTGSGLPEGRRGGLGRSNCIPEACRPRGARWSRAPLTATGAADADILETVEEGAAEDVV